LQKLIGEDPTDSINKHKMMGIKEKLSVGRKLGTLERRVVYVNDTILKETDHTSHIF
jgi:hypothetical protein